MKRGLVSLIALMAPILVTGQDLPQYVDNSVNKYFPPIIDQVGGSCAQASSIGYVFTYEMNRFLDRDASAAPENRFSYQAVWNLVNDGIDQGGFAEDGLFVAMRFGAMTEADYGKAATYSFKWASGFEKYRNAFRYRVAKFIRFSTDIEEMKSYLAGDGSKPGGVVSFSGHSTGWTILSDYSGPSGTGYKALLTILPTGGSHAMTIVGYDDLVTYTDKNGVRHDGAFIVANSWGSYMHDNGRFYYPYDFFRDESVPVQTLSNDVITAAVKFQEPRILFKLTLDYSSRNDLSYYIGATDKASADVPDNFYYQSAISNKGGDLSMRGSFDKEPLEFALDYTDNIPYTNPDFCRYFLKIVRSARGKKGEGSLNDLSVIDYRSGSPVEYKYRGPLPAQLEDGDNWFTIGLVPRFSISCSPVRLGDKILYLRTASGAKARVQMSREGSKATIKYTVR